MHHRRRKKKAPGQERVGLTRPELPSYFNIPERLTDPKSLHSIWHYTHKHIFDATNCFLTKALMKGWFDWLKPTELQIEACGSSAVGHCVTGPGSAAALIDRLTVSIFTESWISVRTLSVWDCLSPRVIGSAAPRQTWKKNLPWFTDRKGAGDHSHLREYVCERTGRLEVKFAVCCQQRHLRILGG